MVLASRTHLCFYYTTSTRILASTTHPSMLLSLFSLIILDSSAECISLLRRSNLEIDILLFAILIAMALNPLESPHTCVISVLSKFLKWSQDFSKLIRPVDEEREENVAMGKREYLERYSSGKIRV